MYQLEKCCVMMILASLQDLLTIKMFSTPGTFVVYNLQTGLQTKVTQ